MYLKWDSRCIIFQHPQNSAHVISVEECLEDKQFLLPFRRSLFLRICFKMTQSAHSAAPSQDSQNWWGRNSPILQQSQECMSEVRCSLVFTLVVWDKTRPISYFLPRRQQLASFIPAVCFGYYSCVRSEFHLARFTNVHFTLFYVRLLPKLCAIKLGRMQTNTKLLFNKHKMWSPWV